MPYHHKASRGSMFAAQESKRMRVSCLANGITPAMVSEACGCSFRHAAKWFSEDKDLALEYQCRLQEKHPVLAPAPQ